MASNIVFAEVSSAAVASSTGQANALTFAWATDSSKLHVMNGVATGGVLINPAGGGTVSGPTATTASQIALFSGTNGNLTYASGSGYITASSGVIGYVAAAASSVLVATATNAVQAMTLGASTVFGQRATGNIGPISYANLKADLALDAVANVDQLPRAADAPVTVTASTTLSSATHGGRNVYCNNTAAITLSITSGTAGQNLQCMVIMSNTATVNIAAIGSELINASSATVASISARWKSAYIHKYASNASFVDAG